MQILTWNVQWCCGLDGLADPARIVRHALAMGDSAGGIDVLCLQEVAVGHGALAGTPGDQVAQLQALLPGWQLFLAPPPMALMPTASAAALAMWWPAACRWPR